MNLNIVELDDAEDVGYVTEDNVFHTNKPIIPLKPGVPLKPGIPVKTVSVKSSAMLIEKPEKKNVSYDDILSSLNMTIVNGKLQIKRTDAVAKPPLSQTIHPPPPPKPLTKEEYRQQIALQYLQKQTTLKKLQESKSKKLMFSNSDISISPGTIAQNTNHLFKFIGNK